MCLTVCVCCINPIAQVPTEYLRPQQETAVHIGEFTLFYRTQPLRLKIEKQQFLNGKSFTMKCEATFGRYTHLTRAKSARVFIVSTDDLTNQKLVNSKNAATATGNQIKTQPVQVARLCKLCNFIQWRRRSGKPSNWKISFMLWIHVFFELQLRLRLP